MSILADFNPKFLPFSLVRDVFIDTGCADFAEIGDGCSLRNALKQPFKEYHGIEVCKRHYDAAVQRAARECGMQTSGGQYSTWFDWQGKSLTFHHGSSPEVLRLPKRGTWGAEIGAVLDPEKSTTIWCDAHWQGLPDRPDEMDPKYGQCPLIFELQEIVSVPWVTPPVVVIDDMNQCGASEAWWRRHGHGFKQDDWPRFGQIADMLAGWTLLSRDGILYCWKD